MATTSAVRLIFIALGFTSLGTWLLIYAVLAIIVPDQPEDRVDLAESQLPPTVKMVAKEA